MCILQALLTPLIAIVAIYIAWQQWKTNKLRLRLETYDRRLRVYGEVSKILKLAICNRNVQMNELNGFIVATAEADFLFGPEIPQYIDEIYSRGLKLCRANEEYRDLTQEQPPGYDHKKIVEVKEEQSNWFYGQISVAKEKFKTYLTISK